MTAAGQSTARRRKCGAKNRNGQPCEKWAVAGRDRCRNHGGKTHVGGPTHPAYKHGRYSAFLPAGLQAMYQASANAPDLLCQMPEVAFLEARIKSLMAGMNDVGATARLWKDARRVYRDWQGALERTARAQAANDTTAADMWSRTAQEFSDQLGRLLEAGASDEERHGEVMRLVDAKRKVSESERGRMVEASMLIRFDQVTTIFDTLLQVVTDEVSDAATLARITAGFTGVLGRPHIAAIGASRPGGTGT